MDAIAIDHVVTTGGNCTAQGSCWYLNIRPTEKAFGVHAVCYEASTGHEIVVLNDQGGSVMDISEDVTACLRAQDHGHPPVICFEPGIAKREGGADRFVKDVSTTLRANMGDNQTAVCYEIENQSVAMGFDVYNMAVTGDVSKTLNSIRSDSDHTPVVCIQPVACYALKGNFIDRETQQNGIGWREMVEYTLDATDRHGVCYEISAGEVRKGKAEVCQTLRSRMGTGGGNVPILIMDMTRRDRVDVKTPDKAPTMQCAMGAGGGNVPVVMIKDE